MVEGAAPGAHLRQSHATSVVIALTPDGVVEVETVHTSQDESYY